MSTRLDVSERVINVPGAQHKRYHTFKDALLAYTHKYDEGAICVTPLAGSRFWPISTPRSMTPPSPSSSDELWACLDDVSEAATYISH